MMVVPSGTARAAYGSPAACPGDCDGDRMVTISELTQGVGQLLAGSVAASCTAFDRYGHDEVLVADLIAAVESSLEGCPAEQVAFTAAFDPDGPALVITPDEALRPKTVYALA